MASPTTETSQFTEHLRAPGWFFAFLGLMLGVVSGGLTAVGIRSLTDEPLISGTEALIFYFCFTIAIVGIVYVMLSSTLMETKVMQNGFTIRLGMLGAQRSFTWDDIKAVRVSEHNLARHGGRGNPLAPSSRRAWTMYGVRSGVEIEILEGSSSRHYFVSSNRATELVDVLERRTTATD